jgi:serpin B
MLREGDALIYYGDETLQALPLEFENGSGMYILLPRDGDAAGLLASLTDGYFNDIQAGSVLAKGKLLLPRFSIEGDVISLGDILKTLGVPLFNEGSLTGVVEETAIRLSDALHKAVIKVDEKGTTAAAATLLPMATSAGPQEPEKIFEMKCDRPFVFVLYDRRQVLFTGMVNRP